MLLFGVCCKVCVACWPLFVVGCSLCGGGCLLMVVCCWLLFVVYLCDVRRVRFVSWFLCVDCCCVLCCYVCRWLVFGVC